MNQLQTRLLLGHPFYAMAYGDNVEPQRFVRLFRGTWRQLPLAARRRICKAWRESPLFGAVARWAAVEIRDVVPTPNNIEHGNSPGRRTGGAAVLDSYSMQLTFWTPRLYALPDEHARALLAHELAHVVLFADPANRERYRTEQVAGLRYKRQKCEAEANALATEWGFDTAAQSRWERKNVLEIPYFEYDRDGTLRTYTPERGWRTEK